MRRFQGYREYLSFSSVILLLWLIASFTIHVFGVSKDAIGEIIPVFCPFRLLTGVSCPGCGMTRAFIALAEFDVSLAIKLNPFSVPLFLYFVASTFKLRIPLSGSIRFYLSVVLIVVIISWWLLTRVLSA
ncbi:MAG: hypothetical protein KatS3mg078_0806 [Deltaproteobacteria bacterium]|nr:MAG: hypothetical protein KatS3mg078_0806 [Deltaproteobacteria bacterium]